MNHALDYIANIRFPTEKAHGAQIAKMCEAFAQRGSDVRLLVSVRKNALAEDPFRYYGIQESFPLLRIWSLDAVEWGAWGFRLQACTFALAACTRLRRGVVLYGRDEMVLWLAGLLRGNPLVWESHTGAWNFFARAVAQRAKRIIVISQGLKDFYQERGVDERKILVAPDGVDLASFEEIPSKEEARSRLGLPQDAKIAMYIGRLDGWKGVETLCAAAQLLPESIKVAVIGGEPEQVRRLSSRYPSVIFLGYHPYRDIANNQAGADALVLPNTAQDLTSSRFTSPLKLFTYMASGKPIIASDLPSLREVLDDMSAFFVPADDPPALAKGIEAALTSPDAPVRGGRAKALAAQYSWSKRADRIVDFLTA